MGADAATIRRDGGAGTIHGTHAGDLMGTAPTGAEVAFSGITVSRCNGGKIVEEWELTDTVGLMRQVGALPG